MHVNRYNELEVYQSARKLSLSVFQYTKNFPKEEMYSLTESESILQEKTG